MVIPTQDEVSLADRIAAGASKNWRTVELDDLKSHLRLWLFENVRYVEAYRQPENEGKLIVALKREANKFCASEQEARIGRRLREDNFYTVGRVARILPFLFDEWPQSVAMENPATGQTYTRGNPEDYGNAVAILADVKGAFYGMSKPVQQLLIWRFRDGKTFDEIAEILNISQPGTKKRVDRALKLLVDALAGNGIK